MNIKTKYNIDDKAYTILDNSIYQVTIKQIHIFVDIDAIETKYEIIAHSGMINFIPSKSLISEKVLFDSPEEVINNIKIVK